MKFFQLVLFLILATFLHGEEKTYVNESFGYRINLPSNWTVDAAGGNISAYDPNKEGLKENLQIVTQRMTFPINFDESMRFAIRSLERVMSDFTLVDSRRIVLAGNQGGYRVNYRAVINNLPIQILQIVLINNDTLMTYILTFAAPQSEFDSYLSQFEKIANSFQP